MIEEQAAEIANVNVHGAIPYTEVSGVMSKARGLVITSRYEGSPKVVIESMASGLPVIAVKSPGLIEIVNHGVNGLLVEPDEQSIADAINRLMHDSELWRELSANGRRMAEDIYSKKSVMSKEISLINRLTNRVSGGV